MDVDLMGGYTAYTNAPDVVAEATTGSADPDEASISITLPLTVSYTFTAFE